MKLLPIILLCTILSVCHGYRILGLFPFHGKSHYMMFERLMKVLAKRGHQVDVVSTFPLKKPYPNYNDIIALDPPVVYWNNVTYTDMKTKFARTVTHAIAVLTGNDVCLHLKNPKVQELIHNPPRDPPYDVVIMEVFGAHCFAIFAELLKVPLIGVSTSVPYPWAKDYIANPEDYAFVPSTLVDYPQNMNFWQRLMNFLQATSAKWEFNYYTKEQTKMLREYVSPDAPDIRELENSMALMLVNSHISINGISHMNPAYVEVGGLHVTDEEVYLQPSLEKWMNDSTHGFVYFSFGSMVKIESFPAKHLDIFYKSMAKIAPIRVLMKIAKPEELPPGLPKNVHVLPWIPQIKVLKHPNIKAFITHGGLMGTQEAIHCGVPLIGVPLFGDQFINIQSYARLNIAIELNLETLTQEKMDDTLHEILNNPKYREAARNIAKKFRDRPLSVDDTAVYWVEYIIRNGADALRSPAKDLTWWQLQLLDVYVFLLACALLMLYALTTAVRYLLSVANFNSSTLEETHVRK